MAHYCEFSDARTGVQGYAYDRELSSLRDIIRVVRQIGAQNTDVPGLLGHLTDAERHLVMARRVLRAARGVVPAEEASSADEEDFE